MSAIVCVGIDPGLDGAIVGIDAHGALIECHDTPTTIEKDSRGKPHRVLDIEGLETLLCFGRQCRVAMEKVGGVTGQSASASFNFGDGYGMTRAYARLKAWNGIVDYVRPSVWKRALGLISEGGPASKKSASLAMARKYAGPDKTAEFLTLVKHEGRAEAYLIALWWLKYGPGRH